MNIEHQLFSLGFSENEVKVYLSLLRTSGNYVSNISKETKIERVSLYYVLELLTKKWLVSFITKNKTKFFVPEKPERIINIFKEKLNVAENLVPWLKMIENSLLNKPSFKYYEWIDWVKEILEEVFSSKSIKSYANLSNFMNYNKELLNKYFEKIKKDNIKLNIILSYNDDVLKYLNNINENLENKINYSFINNHEFPFQYDVFITDKIVWIISLIDWEVVAIKIESKHYIDSQKAIFNLAWLGATSFSI